MGSEDGEKDDLELEATEKSLGIERAKTYTFDPETTEKGSTTKQYLAGISANLLTMTAGCVLGWTSPVLPRLEDPDGWLYVNKAQGSWVASLVPLGATIGPFAGGYLADKIGRKWTTMVLAIPFLLSWVLITAAQNVAMLYSARFIAGLGVGALFTVAPMYCGEIAEDKVRGALGSLLNALITAGFLYEYVIGPYVPYIWLGIASMIVPCVFLVTFFFMPESPYYLLGKGRIDEASKALQWLRGHSQEGVEKEMATMKESVDEASQNSGSFKDLVSTKGNVRALILSFGLVGFQQFSGINAILFYSTTIFQESGGSLNDDVSTIIVGAVMMFSAFTAPLLVERLGRRALLFISATGMFITQLILGVFFYLKKVEEMDMGSLGWLPIVCLVSYIAVYSIGYGPLPWAVIGELWLSNVKGLAGACSASFCWFLGFFITKFFTDIVEGVGIYTAFWIFAGCCVLANIFVFFLLPETKGKSLQEIQDLLNKK